MSITSGLEPWCNAPNTCLCHLFNRWWPLELTQKKKKIYSIKVWFGYGWTCVCVFSVFLSFFLFFFFFSSHDCWLFPVNSAHQRILCTVHETHKLHFSATFSLKMGLMILFTHLKIILLQYFQFSQNKLYPNGPIPIVF